MIMIKIKVKKLHKAVIKKLLPEQALEIHHRWAKFESRLQLIPQRGRSVLEGPLQYNTHCGRVECSRAESRVPCRDDL